MNLVHFQSDIYLSLCTCSCMTLTTKKLISICVPLSSTCIYTREAATCIRNIGSLCNAVFPTCFFCLGRGGAFMNNLQL